MTYVERNSKVEKAKIKSLLKDPIVRKNHEQFDKEFYFRLALVETRKKLKLSQKELALKTGLSQQAISRIETGYSNTTIVNVFKYLDAMGNTIKIVKDTK